MGSRDDCWAYNGATRVISKLESCIVSFSGSTLVITDSGGIGDIVTWTLSATDGSGNTTTQSCRLDVVHKDEVVLP